MPRRSNRATASALAAHDHAAEKHQHDRANDCRENRADVEHAVHWVVAGQQTDNKSARDRTDQTEDDVPDHTQALIALDEQAGEPTGDGAHDDPRKPFHGPYLLTGQSFKALARVLVLRSSNANTGPRPVRCGSIRPSEWSAACMYSRPMSIAALLSKADGTDEAIDLRDWEPRPLSKDELLWIDADAADDVDVVIGALHVDDDLVAWLMEDAVQPGAHVHEGAVEVVILSLAEDLDAEPEPVRIVAGEGWVLTRHNRPVPFLDRHRELIQDQREVGRLTSIELVASMLDWHVDTFFSAAAELERSVDRLDDAALRTERDLVDRLVKLRRRIARVRRIVVPHLDVAAELARRDFLPASMADHSEAFVPVAKRLERAGEAIGNAREMLIGTFDIHMTRMAQRTNDTMRILTLASVILLPSVVLAGVMGMNFNVPLFDQPDLFWVVVAAMLAMGGAALVIAKWRGWL